MRGLKLIAASLAVLYTLVGCTAKAAPAPVDQTATAVARMLDAHNKALVDGDEGGFVADLDPGNAPLTQHERMVFRNLRQLRFTVLSYQLGSSTGIPLGAAEPANTYHHPATLFLVRLRMQVADVDTDVSEARFGYLVASVDGHQRIVGIDPIERGSRQFRAGSQHDLPWEATPLSVARQGDVIMVGDSTVDELDGLARVAEAASVEVRRLWGDRPAPRANLIFLTRSSETFGSWYGPGGDLGQAEGIMFPVQGASSLTLDRPAFVGARVTVNLSSGLASHNMSLLMRHELTHALTVLAQFPVLAARAAGLQPWLLEGFARWVEVLTSPPDQQHQLDLARAAAHDAAFNGRPPAEATFYTQSTVARNYALGWSIFSLLQQQIGIEKTVGVYADAVRLGSGTADFEASLRKAGVDPATFTSQWQSYLRN